MNIRELIDSIESGKTLEVEGAFQSIMAEKVATKLANMRMEVAKNMFATNESVEGEEDEQEFITQEEFDALSDEEKAEYTLAEETDEDLNEELDLSKNPKYASDSDHKAIAKMKPAHIVKDPHQSGVEHHLYHHKGHTIVVQSGHESNADVEKHKGTHDGKSYHKALKDYHKKSNSKTANVSGVRYSKNYDEIMKKMKAAGL
jgi:hypothetical protein